MLNSSTLLHRTAWLVSTLAAGGLFAAAMAGAAQADGDNAATKVSRVTQPVIIIEKEGQCVEPTEVMRRDHMKFILHQRDKTVHQGIRTEKHSLQNCVNCHASSKTNSVVGKEGFCSSCHTYASVSIDCFACHTSKREENAANLDKANGKPPGHLGRAIAISPIAEQKPASTGKKP